MSAHDHSHDHGHGHPSFWSKYVFSTDHKVIGLQYGITACLFLLFGFGLMLIMRWQLAFPNMEIPVIGKWITDDGRLTTELYNQMGAMHGTIMVFLGVVPMAVGAFGNYLVPLMVGAQDMAFPKLNMASYHVFFLGRRHHASPPSCYPAERPLPLDVLSPARGSRGSFGHDFHGSLTSRTNLLAGRHGFLDHLVAARSINTIVTAIQLRVKGLHVHAVASARLGAGHHGVPAPLGVPSA